MLIKKLKVISIIFYVATVGLSQSPTERKLFPVDVGGKCGYLDIKGELKIPPIFDFCGFFSEGLAGVSISRKAGYIDKSGQIVIPLQFDDFYVRSFSEGFAIVHKDTTKTTFEVGYVDKFGRVTMFSEFSELGDFNQGLAKVKKDGKYGYIDKNLKLVIPLKYDLAGSFSDGVALVSDTLGSDKNYYIDKSGRKVIENYGSGGSYFSDGLARFYLKDTRFGYQYGYMDTKGKVVIKPQYGYRCLFKEGLACAENYGKWGFIDKTGKFVIEPQFDEVEDFSTDGVASASLNGKWGFIDKTGKFLVEPQFEKAEWMDGLGFVEIQGKKRYINSKNVYVW